jgi:hypothetical protein
MTLKAAPLKTALSDTYPNPSNATLRAGMGALWDWATSLLGTTGDAKDARALLDVRGWALVSSQTASNSATIDFTGLSGSDDDYMVVMHNVIAGTDDSVLIVRVSQAAAFKSDANYGYSSTVVDQAGSTKSSIAGGANAGFQISDGVTATTVEGGANGILTLYGASNTTAYKSMDVKIAAFRGAVGRYTFTGSGAYRAGATSAVDGLRFLMNSGNIASGTFSLYRLRKS